MGSLQQMGVVPPEKSCRNSKRVTRRSYFALAPQDYRSRVKRQRVRRRGDNGAASEHLLKSSSPHQYNCRMTTAALRSCFAEWAEYISSLIRGEIDAKTELRRGFPYDGRRTRDGPDGS